MSRQSATALAAALLAGVVGVQAAVAASAAGSAAAGSTATQMLNPTADAYVSAASPSTNTGRSTSLRVDGSPIVRSYLRFDLSGVTVSITKATLQLTATSNQNTGFDVKALTPAGSWSETTITYANAPSPGSTLGSSGRLKTGTIASVDVTGGVQAGRVVDFVLTTSSATAATLGSRESATPPVLVLETAASTPPPSNTSPPAISGQAQEGSTLSTTTGTWDGASSFTYGWKRCDTTGANCSGISGAQSSTYTLTSTDVGSTIRSVVTGTNTAGSAVAESAPTGVVAAAPPPAGAPENTSPPTIAGSAVEEQTVTANPGAWTGSPTFTYQWRRCDTSGSGCTDIPFATAATYTIAAVDVGSTLVVAVTASGTGGTATAASNPTGPIASRPPPAGDPVIAAAGDIACAPEDTSFNNGLGTASACREKATSDLLVGRGLARILTLGDLQYECGSLAAFGASFDPTWGREKPLIRPAIGNHEYQTGTGCDSPAGSGYFGYFGSSAGDPTKGYYSYDVGAWHLIALNANCGRIGGCGSGSPEETWLRADLAANQATCTLAYWHQPHFSSGSHGNDDGGGNPTGAFWQALYDGGADLVLNGHDHDYERFAPQTPAGVLDTTYGIREFVVGTGGKNQSAFSLIQPNSEVRNSGTSGVLLLTLKAAGYDWRFVPEAGKTFTDSGSGSCHGAPPPVADTTPPNAPGNLKATAVQSNDVDLSWDAATDDVGVASYQVFRNGTLLATTAGTTYSDGTALPRTTYDYFVKAVDRAGNVSGPSATVTVTTPDATSGSIFADGFETGDFTQWTANNGMTVGTDLVANGVYAARETSTGAATYAYKQLPTPQTDIYYALSFFVASQGANNVYFLKERTATGVSILGLFRSSSGLLGLRNDAGSVTLQSSIAVDLNRWHRLELHTTIAGTASQTEVWLDGQPVTALTTVQNLGTTAVGRVQIGDNTGSRTYDVAIDDVRVANAR